LMVVPIPDKGVLLGGESRWNDSSMNRLTGELRSHGADVFQLSAPAEFLRQDTHWTPAYMDAAAREIAGHVRRTHLIAQTAGADRFRLVRRAVTAPGDLVQMLGLPAAQTLYPPETAVVDQVLDAATGLPAKADSASSVLVLGDSFTNMYSSASLGWGESAGLSEHLAYHLGMTTDTIAFNGSAATAARTELVRAANEGRLDSKRILVYEFASRDLYLEDWPPAPLPVRRHSAAPVVSSPADVTTTQRNVAPTNSMGPLIVHGRITAVSRMPEPGGSPYKDCLIIGKGSSTRGESGTLAKPAILVGLIAIEDEVWTEAARYRVGEELRLTLVPFSKVPARWKSAQRADDIEDYDSALFYAVAVTKE